jgi:hypothetical protein
VLVRLLLPLPVKVSFSSSGSWFLLFASLCKMVYGLPFFFSLTNFPIFFLSKKNTIEPHTHTQHAHTHITTTPCFTLLFSLPLIIHTQNLFETVVCCMFSNCFSVQSLRLSIFSS